MSNKRTLPILIAYALTCILLLAIQNEKISIKVVINCLIMALGVPIAFLIIKKK